MFVKMCVVQYYNTRVPLPTGNNRHIYMYN